MCIAARKRLQAFGLNFVTHSTPWKACYEAICKDDCHFMRLSKKKLDQILIKIDQKNIANEVKFFRGNCQLTNVLKRTILNLKKLCAKPTKFIRNQVLYREGDTADRVFIIKSGDFALNKQVLQSKNVKVENKLLKTQNTHTFLRFNNNFK